MSLIYSLFAQQSTAPATTPGAPGATTTTPPPAAPPPPTAAELEAMKQRGAEAAAEAAGHSEVSLMELVR